MKPLCNHGFCSLPALAVLCAAVVVEVAMASARFQVPAFLSATETGGMGRMADTASSHWVEEPEATTAKPKVWLSTSKPPTTEAPEATEEADSMASIVPGGWHNSVRWSPSLSLDVHLCYFMAFCWVLLLGGTPIFIYKYDNRPVTRTGLVLSALLWTSLFGGLYSFTQVVLFESPHFEEARPLTIIECTYFMTQVITTVGYGDIVPSRRRGELFVGCYVLLAFFVIALLLAEMQGMIVSSISRYKAKLAKHSGLIHENSPRIGLYKPSKPSPLNMILSTLIFAAIAITWVLFFQYYPGEEKSWNDATYMVLITLTSVGFGAVTPMTEGGMIFASFFMFIGSAVLVSVVTNFSTFMIQMAEWEAWDPTSFEKDLQELRTSSEISESVKEGKEISESDFMTMVLLHKKILSKRQVDSILHEFHRIHKKGAVCVDNLRRLSLAEGPPADEDESEASR